jgi:hypothetical protein
MESSAQNNKSSLVKHRMHRITNSHEFMLELSIIATILVCLNFWSHLPDLGIDPIWGRGIAALGVLIIICMIAFRFKWPILIGLAGMVIYLGISHLQNNSPALVTDGNKANVNSPQQQESNPYNVSSNFMQKDSVQ